VKTNIVAVDPKAPQAEVLARACEVLRRGGLVVFPTDTLYALGADALNPRAVERVIAVKGRAHGKPLSVLVPSAQACLTLLADAGQEVRSLMQAFWPGALTIVVKAPMTFPPVLTASTGTVGVRMPGSAVAQALLGAFGGPVIGTSANKSGGADPANALTVQKAIGGQIDLILDGGRVALGVASTVIDCTARPARILREGAVSAAALRAKIAVA
jgi:L-threonylcarbamoyladenylate synthase